MLLMGVLLSCWKFTLAVPAGAAGVVLLKRTLVEVWGAAGSVVSARAISGKRVRSFMVCWSFQGFWMATMSVPTSISPMGAKETRSGLT